MNRLTKCALASIVAVVVATPAGQAGDSGTDRSLDRIALRPVQVSAGVHSSLLGEGRAVTGQATLDVCGAAVEYPSELLRRERLQLVYARSKVSIASNEVIRYAPGGAGKALADVARAVRTCPHDAVPPAAAGLPAIRYTITRLVRFPGTLPGAIVLRMRAQGSYQGKQFDETVISVYQRRYDVMSGVYVRGGAGKELALARRLARASAGNLVAAG